MYGACIYAQICMCKYVCAHSYVWQKSYNSMVHVVRNAKFITNPYELTGHRGIVTGARVSRQETDKPLGMFATNRVCTYMALGSVLCVSCAFHKYAIRTLCHTTCAVCVEVFLSALRQV